MKKIILIRHATAEPERYPVEDFDRSLDDIGAQEAKELGQFIKGKDLPTHILASTSKRTVQTSRILIRESGLDESILALSEPLYNAYYVTMLDEIKAVDDAHDCLAMVAHNPGISQLASALSTDRIYQMSPATAICFSFDCSRWQELPVGEGKETWKFNPF